MNKTTSLPADLAANLWAAATALQARPGNEAKLCCRDCWRALDAIGQGEPPVDWEKVLDTARSLLLHDSK